MTSKTWRAGSPAGPVLVLAFLLALGGGIAGGGSAVSPIPSADPIAPSPFSDLTMLYERTLFRVDVARIRLRVDPATASRLSDIVEGRSYSEALADGVARAVLRAPDAWLRMEFLRPVGFDRFLEGIRGSMSRAVEAGYATRDHYRRVSGNLPRWYSFLRDRGVRKGDVVFYRLHGDSLRTSYTGADGTVFLDLAERDPPARRMILGSYLAPGSDFREGLVRSLLP